MKSNEVIMKHKDTGNVGVFIKEYYVTGRGYTTQIKLDSGSVYYAPSCEFIDISFESALKSLNKGEVKI